MKARASRFKQSDVTRALKGARAAGVAVRVEIDPSVMIYLVPIGDAQKVALRPVDELIEAGRW